MFANISNHPLKDWDAAQQAAALAMAAPIVDVPFPAVDPDADEWAVLRLAHEVASRIPHGVTHAMVQGEMTLMYALVHILQYRGIRCFAATSRRDVEILPDGRKAALFRFVRFREYRV